MECPNCHEDMHASAGHGICIHCKEHCGCSFDPCSMSDYCDFHRPGNRKKGSKARYHAESVADLVLLSTGSQSRVLRDAIIAACMTEYEKR